MTPYDLHKEAMRCADNAFAYQRLGNTKEYRANVREAINFEMRAIRDLDFHALNNPLESVEPTRGILCRSAGHMALWLDWFDEAERLFHQGLGGHPDDITRKQIHAGLAMVKRKRKKAKEAGNG